MKPACTFMLCSLLLFGSALSLQAETSLSACKKIDATTAGDTLVAAKVAGRRSGEQLELAVTPGKLATKGLRVYSEPSHTLLLLAVQDSYRRSPVGRAWMESFSEQKPLGLAFYSAPGEDIVLSIAAPPPTDRSIALWLNGTWPSGEEQELQVADATVRREQFKFQAGFAPTKAAFRTYRHCCSSSVCGEMCVECSTIRFTCCLGNWACCCSITCGLDACPAPADCTFDSCK